MWHKVFMIMLLGFLLLFCVSESEVYSITETTNPYYTTTETHTTTAQVHSTTEMATPYYTTMETQTTTAQVSLTEMITPYNTTTESQRTAVQVGEKLGISALVLALLALIITLTVLSWLCWQRFGDMATTSNTDSKGFPRTESPPKGGSPQTGTDGDVYINYSSNNQVYTDLNSTNMTTDSVYSSLS